MDDVVDRIHRVIAARVPGVSEFAPALKLGDLGLDSLETIDLSMALEDEFGLPTFTLDDWTVETTIATVHKEVRAALPRTEAQL